MERTQLLYYPILDLAREKAQLLQKEIQSDVRKTFLLTDDSNKANIFLVGGGDGFMLDTVKKQYNFEKSPEENKLFFGVNCGTLGFLLNDIEGLEHLPKYLDEIITIKTHMMEVEIVKKDMQKEIKYALNDVVIGGNVLDYFKFDISSQHLNKRFHGTGIMMSTALGSSGYRLNNGGSIMPAGSQLWGVSGLAALPFGHTILKPETIHITITGRTPVMVGVDGYGGKIDDIQEITVQPTTHYAQMAFLQNIPFDAKRMLLAEQKLLKEDF